ncbi:MAG: acylphosphatase [bacterium]|nr:acylphosphatase [bacterium]
MQRVKIRYDGRVQGVGFRATVLDISKNFQVVGQIRNMSDGSVEMIAEGTDQTLQAFCQSIRSRMSRHIVSENADWAEVSQSKFTSFHIASSG